jgi:hypothetical protein
MLAHKATHEGKLAAEVAFGEKHFFDARVIPAVAYTDPEIAWVGLTETEAKTKGIAYEKASFPWAASGRSLALGRDEGMTKLLFERNHHVSVGVGLRRRLTLKLRWLSKWAAVADIAPPFTHPTPKRCVLRRSIRRHADGSVHSQEKTLTEATAFRGSGCWPAASWLSGCYQPPMKSLLPISRPL